MLNFGAPAGDEDALFDQRFPKRPRKPKAAKLIPDELIDQLLAQVDGKDAESILGESGLAGLLKKHPVERMRRRRAPFDR